MAEPRQPDENAGNPMWLDFGPLLLFFAAYKLGDIYWATGAFMIAAPIALAVGYRRERRLRAMPVITAAIVLVFGGMTMWLRDPRFIYVKPTIVAGLTGAVLLGGVAAGRAWMKPLLGTALELDDPGWRTLSLRFGLFSLALAGINELVWRGVTPDAEHLWVWFKFLGIPVLTLLFLLSQSAMLKRHAVKPP